ncbi:chromatin structure-remodeling complex protein SYD [Iris pallida]|uniref:Chromatin structure-remodeling complex protein SYD n=1 Tax=Iris pallida TaxID=29817 RepID=A0AAX6DI56_IRIPA|nr:chromatin structure-remodeling complex protein SYD [Iris pallida]
MAAWQTVIQGGAKDGLDSIPIPSRLVTEEDLKPLYKAMTTYEAANAGVKRKGEHGSLDTQHYGRGKRAREVRSYNDQWTEEEFEKLCQGDSPESSQPSEVREGLCLMRDQNDPKSSDTKSSDTVAPSEEILALPRESNPLDQPNEPSQPPKQLPPVKRGRGRPKRGAVNVTSPVLVPPAPSTLGNKMELDPQKVVVAPFVDAPSACGSDPTSAITQHMTVIGSASLPPAGPSVKPRGRGRKATPGEKPRGRARKQNLVSSTTAAEVNSASLLHTGVDVSTIKSTPVPTDKLSSGVPNVSPLACQVNSISGSQKVVELGSARASRSSQSVETVMSISPAVPVDNKIIGKEVPIYDKSAPVETKPVTTTEHACFLQPKNTVGPSPPTLTTVPQNLVDKRTDVASSDTVSIGEQRSSENKDATSQGNQKALPSPDSKLNEKTKPTYRQDDLHLQSLQTRLLGAGINCDVKSPARQAEVSVQSIKGIEPISVQYHEEQKSAASLHNSISLAVPENDAPLSAPTISSIGDKATHANLAIPAGHVDLSPVPVVTQRAPDTRASVTRKKAAAREPRNRGTSTAACERRARLAGLKQADGSKKVEGKDKTVKAVAIEEKEGSRDSKAGFVLPDAAGSLEDTRPKVLAPASVSIQMEKTSRSDPMCVPKELFTDAAPTDASQDPTCTATTLKEDVGNVDLTVSEASLPNSHNQDSTGKVIEKSVKVLAEVSVNEPTEGNSSETISARQFVPEANPDISVNKSDLLATPSQADSGAQEATENATEEQKNKFVTDRMSEEGSTPVCPVSNDAEECDKARSSDILVNDSNPDSVCVAFTAAQMADGSNPIELSDIPVNISDVVDAPKTSPTIQVVPGERADKCSEASNSDVPNVSGVLVEEGGDSCHISEEPVPDSLTKKNTCMATTDLDLSRCTTSDGTTNFAQTGTDESNVSVPDSTKTLIAGSTALIPDAIAPGESGDGNS